MLFLTSVVFLSETLGLTSVSSKIYHRFLVFSVFIFWLHPMSTLDHCPLWVNVHFDHSPLWTTVHFGPQSTLDHCPLWTTVRFGPYLSCMNQNKKVIITKNSYIYPMTISNLQQSLANLVKQPYSRESH